MFPTLFQIVVLVGFPEEVTGLLVYVSVAGKSGVRGLHKINPLLTLFEAVITD